MDQTSPNNPLLELLSRPAFCVKDGIIIQVNDAANQRSLLVGQPIWDLLADNQAVYQEFSGGCLFLTLRILDIATTAAVTRMDGYDLFLLDQLSDGIRQALALAAQQLRQPLNVVYAVADELREVNRSAQIQHGLSQIHRIICNMSDLGRYEAGIDLQMEATNLTSLFTEAVEKAQSLLRKSCLYLRYTALPEVVIGMADRDLLERAINNLISNAAKFSAKGSSLEVKLVHRGDNLCFTVTDHGDGIPKDILPQVFFRFLREPSIEDSRHGLGMGLAMVCAAAACHKGTVLIDQPPAGGTRVTMTMSVIPCPDDLLRSPVRLIFGDYTGGHDHSLLELSDVLPDSAYRKK